ncbi:hypothetical protein RGUI_3361 [Rhodovulum sp. P5]|nr:hypothetical protein RGUI_3361 [Rhodovulum sp. P5]
MLRLRRNVNSGGVIFGRAAMTGKPKENAFASALDCPDRFGRAEGLFPDLIAASRAGAPGCGAVVESAPGVEDF